MISSRNAVIFIVILFIIGSSAVFSETDVPINKDNWVTHPKVKEIRVIHNEVEQGIKKNNLKKNEKSLEYQGPGKPTSKVIYFNKDKDVRKYVQSGGSGDSYLTYNFYYDKNKTLRFVFIQGGAVSGSKFIHRIYFDKSGERFWEISKYLKGPEGYWPEKWSKKALVRNPWEEFKK